MGSVSSRPKSRPVPRREGSDAEQQLERHKALLRAVAEASPFAYLVRSDVDGQMIYLNSRVQELFNGTDEQPVPPELLDVPEATSLDTRSDEITLADGRRIRRFLSAVRDDEAREFAHLFAFEDVTEERTRQRFERDRTKALVRHQAALVAIAALEVKDVDTTLLQVARITAQTLRVSGVAIWMTESSSASLRPLYVFKRDEKGSNIAPGNRDLPLTQVAEYLHALSESALVRAAAVQDEPVLEPWAQQFAQDGVESAIDVGIHQQGQPCGLLRIENDAPRHWTTDEERFAISVATISSNVLDTAERHTAELDLHRLQVELAKADRLIPVGTLAAGLAHEVNNPLSCVNANLTYVTEMIREFADGRRDTDWDEVSTALTEAMEGTARVEVIVRSLKTFSQVRDARCVPLSPATVLEIALDGLLEYLDPHAKVIREYNPCPSVLATSSGLSGVFENILSNAMHALQKPSTSPAQLIVRTSTEDDGTALIEVIDNGPGLTKEQRRRAFDPFYSTRGVGGGAGLGLFVTKNIVSALGGSIEIDGEPGKGATVRVRLPDASPSAELLDPTPASVTPISVALTMRKKS